MMNEDDDAFGPVVTGQNEAKRASELPVNDINPAAAMTGAVWQLNQAPPQVGESKLNLPPIQIPPDAEPGSRHFYVWEGPAPENLEEQNKSYVWTCVHNHAHDKFIYRRFEGELPNNVSPVNLLHPSELPLPVAMFCNEHNVNQCIHDGVTVDHVDLFEEWLKGVHPHLHAPLRAEREARPDFHGYTASLAQGEIDAERGAQGDKYEYAASMAQQQAAFNTDHEEQAANAAKERETSDKLIGAEPRPEYSGEEF